MRCDQGVRAAFGIGAVARPLILPGMTHHVGTHRIELNIAIAGQHVVLGLGEAGTEAALPERAGAPVGAVDILHVALTQVFHQQGRAIGFVWCEQQVHVIGHQYVSMNRAAKALVQFGQGIQIESVVFVGEEAHRTVFPSLDDVPRDAGEAETGSAGHGEDVDRRG
jgi:hypothetical protein